MYRFLYFSLFLLLFSSCTSNSNRDASHSFSEETSVLHSVSKADNYSKQVILACNQSDLLAMDSLVDWVVSFKPGGLAFNNWPIQKIQGLAIRLDTLMLEKPLFFVDYFNTIDTDPYPIWSANANFQDSLYWHAFLASGINVTAFGKAIYNQKSATDYLKEVKNIVGVMPSYRITLENKSIQSLKETAISLQNNEGILWLDSVRTDSIPYQMLRKALNWKGLIIVSPTGNHFTHLHAGADMVLLSNRSLINLENYRQTKAAENAFAAISRILKTQVIKRYYGRSAKALLKSTKLHFTAKATVIFNKTKQILPLKKYKSVSLAQFLAQKKPTKNQLVIIPKIATDSSLIRILEKNGHPQSLFLFSNASQFNALKNLPYLMYNPIPFDRTNEVLLEQIKGTVGVNGNMIINQKTVKGKKRAGAGLQNLPAEYAFIDSDILTQINSYISSAIDGKAFPGCQVFAIKNQVVIYNKAFGHTNYQKEIQVNNQHLYDLASLTKALSTTLVAMKLWEDGHFKLADKLGAYLPDSLSDYLPNGSTLKNITFQELLTHKSGLPAGFPVIEYMRKAADLENRFTNGFCDYPYEAFQTEVAEDLYLENSFQDSMWIKLNTLWLDPSKEYKYSDVNMNVLYFILKSMIEKKELSETIRGVNNAFERYLYTNFYKPLDMQTTRYKPLENFAKNRIVPTENDRFWRKQLLQGHVHDPNAALYGGIAGNAGLFSNAADVGKLLAMWQNRGVLDGNRYLKAETIDKFSKAQPNTHRGLGFNKRTFTNTAYAMAHGADASSYGHTGFTGTCFWVDPKYKISYVFLSNRVHPKVSRKIYEFNIRTRVHQVFYDAMLK